MEELVLPVESGVSPAQHVPGSLHNGAFVDVGGVQREGSGELMQGGRGHWMWPQGGDSVEESGAVAGYS